MRALFAAAVVLALGATAPGAAQTPTSTPTPLPTAAAATLQRAVPGAALCALRQSLLGGIGRASTVAFTGPIFGTPVCATVANLATESVAAQIADGPSDDALAVAALTGGGTIALPLGDITIDGTGPYVVAPGGTFPQLGDDRSEAPRVVIAFAGQRLLVIATTPITLVDLARTLRDHPGLFDADAIERAVVIASGPSAALTLHSTDGTIGSAAVTTPRMLLLKRR